MKKASLIAISIFASLVSFTQVVKQSGALSVSGTQLVDKMGNPLQLRGVSFGWHNLWPRFYNKGAVDFLVDNWKANVIRASMGIELNELGYLKNKDTSEKCMTAVIDACIKKGVYVIIDWHDHNIHEKEAIDFFDRISKKYGGYDNIIYEIFNEPDYETWPEVKAYSEKVIAAIRKNDPDNVILVGSPRWDQDVQLPAADPIKGYINLMYTMHFYSGTHKKWLRDRTDEAIKAGLPIFISECAGMEATGDGPIDQASWKEFLDWMNVKGLSWVCWSLSDKVETCSMLVPGANSNGNWKEGEIKEWGKMVRSAIQSN